MNDFGEKGAINQYPKFKADREADDFRRKFPTL